MNGKSAKLLIKTSLNFVQQFPILHQQTITYTCDFDSVRKTLKGIGKVKREKI